MNGEAARNRRYKRNKGRKQYENERRTIRSNRRQKRRKIMQMSKELKRKKK